MHFADSSGPRSLRLLLIIGALLLVTGTLLAASAFSAARDEHPTAANEASDVTVVAAYVWALGHR
jgi:hypothetical protein